MKIEIFDSLGNQLYIGNLVKIQHQYNGTLTFFARVEIVNGQIFPICNFMYDRIFKVDRIPENCNHVEARGNMPEYWVNRNVEIQLINDDLLDKWRMDALCVEHNSFIRVTE